MGDQERTIWCGNLSSEVNEDLLYELFLQAGPVENVTLPRDVRSGESRSFAFILYEHEQSVHYAVELFDGTELFGRRLRLQPKSDDFQEKHRHVDDWLGWGHRYRERPPSPRAHTPPFYPQHPQLPGYPTNGLPLDPSLVLRQGFAGALAHVPSMHPDMIPLGPPMQHPEHAYRHRGVYRESPYQRQDVHYQQYSYQQQYRHHPRDRCRW